MGLTVKLDGDDAEFVERMIAEGRFASADAVLQEALADLRRREALRWLREAIEQGERDVANGDYRDAEEVFAELEREFGPLDR